MNVDRCRCPHPRCFLTMVLFPALLLCSMAATYGQTDSASLIGMANEVGISGHNITLTCQYTKNSSTDLQAVTGPPHVPPIEWIFRAVQSNTTRVVLNSTAGLAYSLQPAAGEPTKDKVENENDIAGKGKTKLSNRIKYLRNDWMSLTVLSIGEEDAGTYTCNMISTGQSVSANLNVIASNPECSKDNPGPVYYEGNNVTLICTLRYHGNDKPTLTWRKPSSNIDHLHVTEEHSASERTVRATLQLRLKHNIDGKVFSCTARFVAVSTTYACTTTFRPETVRYGAYITTVQTYPRTTLHDHRADIGSNLSLYCTSRGNPTPQVSWTFTSKQSSAIEDLPCKAVACPLHNLGPENAGTYTCTVTNMVNATLRSDTRSITVQVVPRKTTYVMKNTEQPPAMIPIRHQDSGLSSYAVGAIVSASLAVVLIVIFIVLAMKMRTRERRVRERMTRMHDENLDDQEVELLDDNIQPDGIDLPSEYGRLKQQWEMPRKDVRLVDLTAKGSFVEVWRGRMRKYPRRNDIMKVAIKRIVSEATEKEKKFFLAELEVMKAIQPHLNILPLIGCYTATEPWLIMVEFAVEGSLYQYLQHCRPGNLHVEIHAQGEECVSMRQHPLSSHKLLSLAAQVVNGLEHLNKFKMIYYRLRASSILVCKGGTCKLSGFGFIQDITERNLYEGNSAPIRWLAPESLVDNVYNCKTDIWAFGILLWEIVHFGHLPYPDMGPHEVAEKIHTGYRMSKPPHCSDELHNLMLMCWAEGADNRPSFGDIMSVLTHLAENSDTHIVLASLPAGLRNSDILENSSAIA